MGRHPNILQITTHDSGRHFGCYGHPTLHTPAIDALAAEGVRLTNYFAAVPICSASRATQLTGLYPQTHGLMHLCGYPFRWRIRDDVRHMSQLLKAAGYTTHLFGIQHEVVPDELPRLAFDSIRGQGFPSAKVIAADVADLLRSRGKEPAPFYAQVGFFQTHTPFDHGGVKPDDERGVEVPPYLADCESSRKAMAAFQGAIRHVDEAVGFIVEALRKSGLQDDTIVVFTTDHGIEMPRAKWFLYDPGVAIGCIVRYPGAGATGGTTCDLLLSNVDYLPTLFDLAGIPVPGGLHGRSFAASLRGECSEPVREAIFALYHKSQSRCVRTSRYSLIRHFDAPIDFATVPVCFEEVLAKRGIPQVELYDLEADPNQFENVASKPEYADIKVRLDTMLWEWMESVNDPLLKGPVRSPSYESAMADYGAWKGNAHT
ncbi:MAG TPA: sulfatase [Candidatus Latescibacteria bacterium]|nr:sulfatase [Candidatus Latescibacterota bacterium]